MRRTFLRLLLPLLIYATVLPLRAEPAALAVGDAVPAFDTLLLNGRTLDGKALLGRPLLVVFWATWCPTCRKELPELQKLHDAYKGKGFELLALSIDAERLEVDEFWADHRYNFPVAMRTPRHSEIFGATRTPPRFFLIGRDGHLAMRHVGAISYQRLEAALKPLL